MIKNSFWGLIWSSFQEIQGFWIGFLGVFITIILSRFPVKTPIPLDVVIIIGFFILLFIATLLKAVDKSFKEYQKIKRRIVPRILVCDKLANNDVQILAKTVVKPGYPRSFNQP